MVGTIVAVKAVESATDNEGLINQAFKLTILIGVALAIGLVIYLVYNLTNVLDNIGDTITEAGGSLAADVGNFAFNLPKTIFTFGASVVTLGRWRPRLRKTNIF